jgi:hypothetical protein
MRRLRPACRITPIPWVCRGEQAAQQGEAEQTSPRGAHSENFFSSLLRLRLLHDRNIRELIGDRANAAARHLGRIFGQDTSRITRRRRCPRLTSAADFFLRNVESEQLVIGVDGD